MPSAVIGTIRGALIERAGELDALEAARRQAATGRGGVLVVEGPAGIGKTRLLDTVRDWAPEVDVLSAHGGVLERDIPFGVARQLLEHRLLRAGDGERGQLLTGPAARAEQVLGVTEESRQAGLGVGGDIGASLHCLYWVLVNLAERGPLVLAVDDAHWADLASLQLLLYLARRIEGIPILVVVATCGGEAGPHQSVLAEVAARATTLRPAPLSAEGVTEVVELVLGIHDPELAEACREATGGNPFLLAELLAAVRPIGAAGSALVDAVRAVVPSGVARSVLLRVGRLPTPAPRLAVAAAVLGDGAHLRHAAELAGISRGEAEHAADALVRVAVLAEVHPLRFEHPLVRAALVKDVPPAERAALHRRTAHLLHEEGAPADRVVPHLLAGSPAEEEWAVETLRQAARGAAARGAPDVAVRLLERAIEEPPPRGHAELLAELAHAQFTSGALEQCLATFGRALEAAADSTERVRIRLRQVIPLVVTEGSDAAIRSLEDVLGEVADVDGQLAMRVEAELVMLYTLASRPHPAFERLQRYRAVRGDTSTEGFLLALLAQQSLRRDERREVTRELALRALAGGRLLEDAAGQALSYCGAAAALIDAEAPAEARASLDAGLANATLSSFRLACQATFWLQGVLSLREGDLVAAEADARSAVEDATPSFALEASSLLALVLLEQGDVAAARATLEQAGLFGEARQPFYLWGPYVRGLVLAAQGRPAEALADFREVGRHATEVGGFAGGLPWQAQAALALHALGDHEGAEVEAAEQLERARRRGAPGYLGIALRAAGLVTAGERRVARLCEAVEVLERSAARLEVARTRYDLGVALLRAGRRGEGRERLEKALEGARACGARGLAQAAHEELRVAGARPRRLVFSGVEALTASERRVAEMAAAGLTNHEIAQALFVAPKTVENHLSRVYAKVELSSRRGLSAALAPPH